MRVRTNKRWAQICNEIIEAFCHLTNAIKKSDFRLQFWKHFEAAIDQKSVPLTARDGPESEGSEAYRNTIRHYLRPISRLPDESGLKVGLKASGVESGGNRLENKTTISGSMSRPIV